MHIKPLLSNLPSPPNGKTGWPWDEEFKPQHKLCRKYQDYPTISLITPVLNQGNSIEETIRSVLFLSIILLMEVARIKQSKSFKNTQTGFQDGSVKRILANPMQLIRVSECVLARFSIGYAVTII
jgi:hypothetical protein